MYSEKAEHKEQTAMLLRHMTSQWGSVRKQVDVKALRETLLVFREVNSKDAHLRNGDVARSVEVS